MANNDPLGPAAMGPRPVEAPRPPATAIRPAIDPAIDDEHIQIAEADALALFIARRGNLLGDDDMRKDAYKDLQAAIASAKAGKDENFEVLLNAYARVSAFTYAEHGVNGRTVLDTEGKDGLRSKTAGHFGVDKQLDWLRKPRNRPLVLGGTLLFMVGIFEGTLLITGSNPAYSEFNETLLGAKELLRPLVWGALGTSVFLMKKLSDKLSAFSFEEARARGMGTRILLGAVLGLIVVELARGNLGTPPAFPVYIVAFLAGLGIKPVYATIESLVEGLAARIKPPKQGGKT